MLEYEGIVYELKYNLGRIKLIENSTGKSVLANIKDTGGMLSIADLESYVAFGIKEAGSDVFLSTKKGTEVAEGMILEQGYEPICEAVLNELMDDCPFFFQES